MRITACRRGHDWEAQELGKTRDVAVDDRVASYVYATENPYMEPKTLYVFRVGDDGESGWTYTSTFTSASAASYGEVAADDYGRVVFLERWDLEEDPEVELVWVGQ